MANGVRCLVERAFVGPVESPIALAKIIEREWSHEIHVGTLSNPWIVALLLRPSDAPDVDFPCFGHWRFPMGWTRYDPPGQTHCPDIGLPREPIQ